MVCLFAGAGLGFIASLPPIKQLGRQAHALGWRACLAYGSAGGGQSGGADWLANSSSRSSLETAAGCELAA